MDKVYQHQLFEDKIYRLWERAKAFTPKIPKLAKGQSGPKAHRPMVEALGRKKPFTIIMPPPNANGSLHIGHAMFVTLEDIMARFHRLRGEPTLMLPGADHAGILTQVVFERKLAKEGKSRFDLGRRRFYKECLRFTLDNKKIMYQQIKKIGSSCDWSREKFTLDPDVSAQVIKTFMQLYTDGLIYRAARMINWCPRCMTALSDLEVEHQEIKSLLYLIKYPLVQHSSITGDERFIMVATTRPETMLGDTAVAVHPDDKRYSQFIGQKIALPLTGRQIPIIANQAVDPEFGTGAVKVTPAHDSVDFAMAQKHKLSYLPVIGFNNRMLPTAGEFAGLKVKEAKENILKTLQKQDRLVTTKHYVHQVGHCERCQTVIEPQVSLQWFVKVKPLAQKAIGVVKTKKIRLIPKRFTKNYLHWMKNIHDWCISRQLWWGHRIPVWYCGEKGLSELQKSMNPGLVNKIKNEGCGKVIVSSEKPKRCPQCGKKNTLIQDPDTLDTWFSSGQWPYTTLGYPKSRDYGYFYPTSVMETGYEILPIWVAKMIMLGLYRTGKIPFEVVYLHGMVRDAFGQKMSKSRGNVINPLEVIAKFGADALRMALVVGASAGNDISLGEPKIKGYRNFANKVWNISRFILSSAPPSQKLPNLKTAALTLADKAILKKCNQLIKQVTKDLEAYKFSRAGEAIYHFLWHELADKYLESTKIRSNHKQTALAVLTHILINSLKLLHPFMPFITEAIWQELSQKPSKLLITAPWPEQVAF